MKKIIIALFAMFLMTFAGFAAAVVDLNSATAAELDALKGVGAAKAKAIIDYRDKNGPFKSVDELAKRLDKFPNMAVDMAERICHLQFQSRIDREKVRNFVIKYQDRLIYGTDFGFDSTSNIDKEKIHWHKTWLADWKYFVTNETMTATQFDGEFRGLRLPREVVDKIYRINAVHWYKLNK